MKVFFNCQCCNNRKWYKFKEYHYENKTSEKIENNISSYVSKYRNLRRQILFEVWFPNKKEITLTSVYCESCGFMCYSPRPNQNDLQAKYQYLSEHGNIGTLSEPTPRALLLDRKRELFMNKIIANYHSIKSQNVLDVGGGDGRLLKPFLDQNCNCNLVDFNPTSYPGVKRIGSTLNDIPDGTNFDILICSHVLEHVSDPGEFLRQLRYVLKEDGVVYIEVPLEIWQGIPIDEDPVTHINFFTESSLKLALLLNGLQPLCIRSKFSTYDGKYKRVVWAIATYGEIKKDPGSVSSIDTRKKLEPALLYRIIRKAENFWLRRVLNYLF